MKMRTYAGVEADGLCVNAQVAELDQLLELDGQGRHDAGSVGRNGRCNNGLRVASNSRRSVLRVCSCSRPLPVESRFGGVVDEVRVIRLRLMMSWPKVAAVAAVELVEVTGGTWRKLPCAAPRGPQGVEVGCWRFR